MTVFMIGYALVIHIYGSVIFFAEKNEAIVGNRELLKQVGWKGLLLLCKSLFLRNADQCVQSGWVLYSFGCVC